MAARSKLMKDDKPIHTSSVQLNLQWSGNALRKLELQTGKYIFQIKNFCALFYTTTTNHGNSKTTGIISDERVSLIAGLEYGMEWNGMKWKWNGMEWNEMEMEWNGEVEGYLQLLYVYLHNTSLENVNTIFCTFPS